MGNFTLKSKNVNCMGPFLGLREKKEKKKERCFNGILLCILRDFILLQWRRKSSGSAKKKGKDPKQNELDQ